MYCYQALIRVSQEPDGVKMLATEFAKAGADVTQTFTFYSTDDWIDTFECSEKNKPKKATVAAVDNVVFSKSIPDVSVPANKPGSLQDSQGGV